MTECILKAISDVAVGVASIVMLESTGAAVLLALTPFMMDCPCKFKIKIKWLCLAGIPLITLIVLTIAYLFIEYFVK